jgi:hypothetical protein
MLSWLVSGLRNYKKEIYLMKTKKPEYLYRYDDGIRFTRQANGKYTMDISVMQPKYEYSYNTMMIHGFVDCPSKCQIERYGE